MIIISSRKDFDDPDNLSRDGHRIKEIDLANDTVVRDLTMQGLVTELQGQTVLVLVHGYNNEQFEVYDAYKVIEDKVNALTPGVYDAVIGYSWPGGDRGLEWWQGKSRANAVARMFRSLIEEMSNSVNAVDLMSHSLGARVSFKALKESPVQTVVRNYFCTAPAVDNECLEPSEEFFESLSSCGRLFVFHSARDGVLRISYEAAEWDRALGLYGPEDKDYISRRARTIYVANCKKIVRKHGGYKRADGVYKYISAYHTTNPAKFKTL